MNTTQIEALEYLQSRDTAYNKATGRLGFRFYRNTKYGDIAFTGPHQNIKRLLLIPRVTSLYKTIIPHRDVTLRYDLRTLVALASFFDLKATWASLQGMENISEAFVYQEDPMCEPTVRRLHATLVALSHHAQQGKESVFLLLSARSRIDGSFVGNLSDAMFYVKKGLTEIQNKENKPEKSANIGFCPTENKWYGWSHRALCGFTVGSQVTKGHCAYAPTDRDDFQEDSERFWSEEDHLDLTSSQDEEGVTISWTLSNNIKNEGLRGAQTSSFRPYPDKWGRGEWTARTMEDARQMACDFAEGVS